MKLAVFLPNWVGDVVMTTPALRALRDHYSSATIIGVMRPYVAETLAGTDLLNDNLLDAGKGWTRGVWSLSRQLKQAKIDIAILFTNSLRTAAAARLGNCKERIGYARDREARAGRGWTSPVQAIWCSACSAWHSPMGLICQMLSV